METPNFECCPSLERLDLSGCTNLHKVHPSIGLLERLVYLNLRDCTSLVSLSFGSESVCKLSSLIVLHLSGCTRLENTPDFSRLLNLEYLDLDECVSLAKVHESIWALGKLGSLSLRGCRKLKEGPDGIDRMTSLQTLDFELCSDLSELQLIRSKNKRAKLCTTIGTSITSLVQEALTFLDLSFCTISKVPDDIGELRGLERLNLQGNPFSSLPDTIWRLSSLAYLNLDHCFNLSSLPPFPFVNDSSGGRYFKTVSGSRNQRCGFDILFPGVVIPRWYFNHQFEGGSTIRIVDSDVDDNWIGFAFCLKFRLTSHAAVSGFSHNPLSTTLPSLLYLSFESEHAEETFCMPCHLDPVSRYPTLEPRVVHVWIIYISRPHCHFLKTGANITFKASPKHIEMKNWGLRMVFKQDIEAIKNHSRYPEIFKEIYRFNDFKNDPEIQLHDHRLVIRNVHKSSNGSTGPKIQLPYNWYVTDEEEKENMEAKDKENNLANIGL